MARRGVSLLHPTVWNGILPRLLHGLYGAAVLEGRVATHQLVDQDAKGPPVCGFVVP